MTGGFVYRGQLYPSLTGFYFFTDYCSDRLWSLHDSSGNWILGDHGVFSGNRFSTFGEDRNGELYVAGVSSGKVYRIVDTGTAQTVSNLSGSSFRVYPNPVEDQLWIETGRPGQSPVQVRVLDLRGAVVLTRRAGGDPFNIGLGFLAPGMYLLEIQNGNSREIRKLIKR